MGNSVASGVALGGTGFVATHTHIETPENVWLSFRLAGPGPRLTAYAIDVGIRVVVILGLLKLVEIFAFLGGVAELTTGLLLVILFLAEWLYSFFFEGFWSGRTPGKRAMRLRVIRTDGCPITIYDALLRNLLRAADVLPFCYTAGFLSAFLSPRFQRIGDRVAGTMVIHEKSNLLRGDLAVLERMEPFSGAELRFSYRPTQQALLRIESLLRRRRELPRPRVQEIAAILSKPLAARMGYQGEIDDHVKFLLRTLRTFSGVEERTPKQQPLPMARV